MGRGIGYVDVHLLAAAATSCGPETSFAPIFRRMAAPLDVDPRHKAGDDESGMSLMAIQHYSSLEEMIAELKTVMDGDPAAALTRATEFFWSGELAKTLAADEDPFSDRYRRNCMALWSLFSGRSSYDPHVDERSRYIEVERTIRTPRPGTPLHPSADTRELGIAVTAITFDSPGAV